MQTIGQEILNPHWSRLNSSSILIGWSNFFVSTLGSLQDHSGTREPKKFCVASLFLQDTVSLKMPQGAKKNSLFGRKQKVQMKREGKVTLTTHSNQSKNKKVAGRDGSGLEEPKLTRFQQPRWRMGESFPSIVVGHKPIQLKPCLISGREKERE